MPRLKGNLQGILSRFSGVIGYVREEGVDVASLRSMPRASPLTSRAARRLLPGVVTSILVACIAAGLASGCGNRAALTQLLEGRRLASELHVEFTKASEAATRAVMADTDEASAAAASEARRAREVVERDIAALQPALLSLGYRDDVRYLDSFKTRFEEYRRLDDEILTLAVENTNLKAQRLSFGPARDAADAFRTSLDAALRSDGNTCSGEALAAKARIAVLETQVMQAPHIAEADDAAMTRMEEQMAASEAAARKALEELKMVLAPGAGAQLTATVAALDRFKTINTEIVRLSRRNSNVRSLALSIGRKRTVTAQCEDQLRVLDEAIAGHTFTATR